MKNTFIVKEGGKGYVTFNGKQYKNGDAVPEGLSTSSLRFLFQRKLIESSGSGSTAVTSPATDAEWGKPSAQEGNS